MTFVYSGKVDQTLKSWSVRLKDLYRRVVKLESLYIDDFSLTEVLTNKRFLGKPVYRKCIYIASLPNTTDLNTNHYIGNIDKFIPGGVYGIAFNSTPTFVPLPRVDDDSAADIEIYANTSIVRVETAHDASGFEAYIALEYTKTTD